MVKMHENVVSTGLDNSHDRMMQPHRSLSAHMAIRLASKSERNGRIHAIRNVFYKYTPQGVNCRTFYANVC